MILPNPFLSAVVTDPWAASEADVPSTLVRGVRPVSRSPRLCSIASADAVAPDPWRAGKRKDALAWKSPRRT